MSDNLHGETIVDEEHRERDMMAEHIEGILQRQISAAEGIASIRSAVEGIENHLRILNGTVATHTRQIAEHPGTCEMKRDAQEIRQTLARIEGAKDGADQVKSEQRDRARTLAPWIMPVIMLMLGYVIAKITVENRAAVRPAETTETRTK